MLFTPLAVNDKDLLHQGWLHPHVRLQQDPLQHLPIGSDRIAAQSTNLSFIHEVDVTVSRHPFLKEGQRRNLFEAKVEGDLLARDLNKRQLEAVQLVVDALEAFQLVLVLPLLALVVEEHGDHVGVGNQLFKHVLCDVLDDIRVLAMTNPRKDRLVA